MDVQGFRDLYNNFIVKELAFATHEYTQTFLIYFYVEIGTKIGPCNAFWVTQHNVFFKFSHSVFCISIMYDSYTFGLIKSRPTALYCVCKTFFTEKGTY